MHTDPQIIHNALQSLPCGLFVLTSSHDQFRSGIITKWVQQCSETPPMLVVAVRKGQTIEPILRDARAFTLNMVPDGDRNAIRRFGRILERGDDPFLSMDVDTAVTGMPILKNAVGWFDCELEGHLSPDADCRLYLGRVVAAHMGQLPKARKPVAVVAPVPEVRKKSRTPAATVSNKRGS